MRSESDDSREARAKKTVVIVRALYLSLSESIDGAAKQIVLYRPEHTGKSLK